LGEIPALGSAQLRRLDEIIGDRRAAALQPALMAWWA
jgi:hypothetical protein